MYVCEDVCVVGQTMCSAIFLVSLMYITAWKYYKKKEQKGP